MLLEGLHDVWPGAAHMVAAGIFFALGMGTMYIEVRGRLRALDTLVAQHRNRGGADGVSPG